MESFSVERLKVPTRRTKRYRHVHLQSWRQCETISALFAIAGWAVATLDYELRYSSLRNENNCEQVEAGNTLRWIDVMLTVGALAFLALRHQAKYMWNYRKLGGQRVLGTMGRLALESFLLCLFPYPYLEGEVYVDERHIKPASYLFERHDVCYTGSELLYTLMFLRFFFILRALVNTSQYMDGQAKQACRQYGVKANMRFTLRALAQAQPLMLLILLYLPIALLGSQLIRLFERPYVPFCGKDFSAYTNSVYFTFVAMTTIAFGDFYPCTQLGRYVSVVLEVWGMGLLSMMIYIINQAVSVDRQGENAYSALRRTRIAALLIKAWYIRYRKPRNAQKAKKKLLLKRQEEYKQGKRRLFSARTLQEGKRKELHMRFDETEQKFARISTRIETITRIQNRLQYVSQLFQCLDAPRATTQH